MKESYCPSYNRLDKLAIIDTFGVSSFPNLSVSQSHLEVSLTSRGNYSRRCYHFRT